MAASRTELSSKAGVAVVLLLATQFSAMFCAGEAVAYWDVLVRQNGDVSFEDRTFDEYADGFGDIQNKTHDFFLGLRAIHETTWHNPHVQNPKLRLTFTDWEGNKVTVQYNTFFLYPVGQNYRLAIGDYQGGSVKDELALNNNFTFATVDRPDPNGCVKATRVGWWYSDNADTCTGALPFGHYYHGGKYKKRSGMGWDGMFWEGFKGFDYSLKSMKWTVMW